MKLIIGLGNPGLIYRNTRHNLGFLVVKALSKKFDIPIRTRKYKGFLGKGLIEGEKVTLFMPQTYMNLSGHAVGTVIKMEEIEFKNTLIIYDDIDLRFGFMRLRGRGSSGGHKGLESIITHLETAEIPRLRIGIGKTGNKTGKATETAQFVLSPFDAEEKPLLKEIIDRASGCAVMWLKEGLDKAMLVYNQRGNM